MHTHAHMYIHKYMHVYIYTQACTLRHTHTHIPLQDCSWAVSATGCFLGVLPHFWPEAAVTGGACSGLFSGPVKNWLWSTSFSGVCEAHLSRVSDAHGEAEHQEGLRVRGCGCPERSWLFRGPAASWGSCRVGLTSRNGHYISSQLLVNTDPETTRPDQDACKDPDGALAAGVGHHSWSP